MKQIRFIFLITAYMLTAYMLTACMLMLVLAACNTQAAKGRSDGLHNWDCGCIYKDRDKTPGTTIIESGLTGLPFSGENARDLFHYPHVPLFDVYLDQEVWKNVKMHARDEEYAEAYACFEGKDIGRVGIRFKGSYGSLYNCFDENGKNICRKLSLKLKFNEYDINNRFFGLKRLNFHGNRYDNTYIRERLAYDLYRDMGIFAPRVSWAMLRVNNECMGLFGMVEQVDGRFTADRWPGNPDGNLYKEVWPVSTDPGWVVPHLKTNKRPPQVDAFIAFSQAVSSAAEDELRTVLGRFFDLDYMARYMAVDDAIANYDGITAYYTSEDALWVGNHNFYFYEESAAQFTIIPWDLESTFNINSGFGNVPRWTGVPEDCGTTYAVWGGGNRVIAPGCDRVFRGLAADMGKYREACRVLLDGPFTEGAMCAAIDRHAAFIRKAVKADPHGPGVTAFEKGITFLKKEIPRLRSRLESLVSGQPWVPIQISLDTSMGFEEQDTLGLSMGGVLLANPNTTVSVKINTTHPIAGNRDLVFYFEFANEKDPYGQWAFYRIPLVPGPTDLTGYTGIRMKVRADSNRVLRLDIDSPKHTAADQGICYGWDIRLKNQVTEAVVLFADAAIVSWAVSQGRAPGDNLNDILETVNGITFSPQCNGRKLSGQLPRGSTDKGFIRVDDIEIF